MADIADPRSFPAPEAAPADAAAIHRLAHESLTATTGQEAQAREALLDARLDEALAAVPADEAGRRLAAWIASAPSLAIRRHVWRALAGRCAAPSEDVGVQVFAIPLVIVAGRAGNDGGSRHPGTLPDVAGLAATLQEHGALGGNRSFALANVLAAADDLDVAAQPALLLARRAPGAGALALPPAPLDYPAGESVHLRFLVGSAITAAAQDVTRDGTTGRWGLPLTRQLSVQLAAPGITVLALPRPAVPPLAAVAQGRAAQRDASAQLFASNAIRTLRASVGEPAAVISAHRTADAPDGGELRLSLSSPFSPRDAYGFRCPILAHERAQDALAALLDLLRDARVSDVRVVGGVHADRDPVTGGPLMFKPETIPPGSTVH